MIFFRIFTLYVFSLPVFAEAEKPITVVELYTSQGCYSCPPADKLLGTLKKHDNIIAFSCHVTYWNYLGWRDTFSRSFCDNRQRRYQRHLKGYKGVYTPQMIVNGRYAAVGSRKQRVQAMINHTQDSDSVASLDFSVKNQQLVIQPLDASTEKVVQLYLLGISGDHFLPIKTGENAGKKLPYHNPVEHSINLGQWDTTTMTSYTLEQYPSAIKEWIVIAQASPLGHIIAAGKR